MQIVDRLKGELASVHRVMQEQADKVGGMQKEVGKLRQVDGALRETLGTAETTVWTLEVELSDMRGEIEGLNARLLGAKERRVELVFSLNKSLEVTPRCSWRARGLCLCVDCHSRGFFIMECRWRPHCLGGFLASRKSSARKRP